LFRIRRKKMIEEMIEINCNAELPEFVDVVSVENNVVCDDDSCQHNSHPSGWTTTTIRANVGDRWSEEGSGNSTKYFSEIIDPDSGETWVYVEEWGSLVYPLWARWYAPSDPARPEKS
jgi:hypothetical protein